MTDLSAPPPVVLVPWPNLDLPHDAVAAYDGTDPPGDFSDVQLYVVPYDTHGHSIELIPRLPSLRAVQVLTAGYDDVMALLPAGVQLYNGRGLHDSSTAEHAVALMLAAQRDLPRWSAGQTLGHWDGARTRSLAGTRVVIVGYGSIGAAIEARLRGFGVEIVRVAGHARPDEAVHGVESLDDLLPAADIVCLVTPLTERTRGLVDARRLALMSDDALLVNVGRGAVVDTAALLAEAGRIRAALDVVDPEPLPDGHPLWDAPGVIITPHVGGGSTAFWPVARTFVTNQVSRFLAGHPLDNQVVP